MSSQDCSLNFLSLVLQNVFEINHGWQRLGLRMHWSYVLYFSFVRLVALSKIARNMFPASIVGLKSGSLSTIREGIFSVLEALAGPALSQQSKLQGSEASGQRRRNLPNTKRLWERAC